MAAASSTAFSPALALLRAAAAGSGADEDGARAVAETRLEESLGRLRSGGIDARGEVGDSEPLQAIAPAEAAGLVPLKAEETSELDKKVAQFVDELAALDSNSPEFGKKVDQLTAMGRKEIGEAAGASNRFLDRRFLVSLPGSDAGFFNDRGFFGAADE